MLTPNELEAISMMLNKPMRELEMRIMEDIVRRIKINGEITRAADWQVTRLSQLGMSRQEIQTAIQEALGFTAEEMAELYRSAVESGYVRSEELYNAVGKELVPFAENYGLQQLISSVSEQTLGTLQNITQSLGFAVRQPDGSLKFEGLADYYQKTLDSAMLDIASGAFDYNTVLRRTVKEMTSSGLRSVDYATGWSNRADVAARRSVMTGISQLTAKINDDNARELDTDWFEVTLHSGARPSHQIWQGKWYTRRQLEEICGLGKVDGLCGANCYHDYYPVIPGISEPAYTKEELAEMNAAENVPVEYGGRTYTKYEAQQRQRRIETAMRAQRQEISLLQAGGADEDDIINARARYRAASHEYAQFSQAMGIPQQRERVTVDGLENVGVGKIKTDLTDRDYNDIIYMKGKMSDLDVRKWYLAHDKTIPDLIDKSLPVEEQARQACDLRNKFRTQARNLMADQEMRKELDITDPNKSFEELIASKMERKNMTRSEAVEDILKTATKTRKSVNKKLGLE